jgi:hypothetical protein
MMTSGTADTHGNKIIGWVDAPEERLDRNNGDGRNVRFSADSRVRCYFSEELGAYCYLWGIPAHPGVSWNTLPKWCLETIARRCYGRLKELVGTFIIIVDEPREDRVTLVNDILGIRPLFIGRRRQKISFGSNVWAMYRMGLSEGQVDYDAVASWIAYGYNCTQGSLLRDLRWMPPGSAVVIRQGRMEEHPYAELPGGDELPPMPDVAADLHDIVASTTGTLLSGHPRVTVALSGGFDSRYLLALTLKQPGKTVDCVTVRANQEGEVPFRVGEALGVAPQTIPVRHSVWDCYDEVHHFTSDGFPISKFVTHLVAAKHPERPMINGYLGGPLLRGSRDRCFGKYETEWAEDLAGVLQRHNLNIDLRLMRKDVAARILDRSRVEMEQAVENGKRIGKVFAWANCYYRQSRYLSNNFLQHLELTEALLPLYSWDLLEYKMSHHYRALSREVYLQIFRNNFPEMAGIAHSAELRHRPYGVAKCARRFARQIMPELLKRDWMSLLDRKSAVLHDLAGLVGYRKAESSMMQLQRLYLLEKETWNAGIELDWDRL